ncbi:Hypothetical predicted protein [Pelobates cultripes]|uniref:Uncharacterized protein n=1 Tax=Pelobates cultripes TaxID=61616 RepID=A0AAD1T101_PELCU|nr:Hypothetical predicted protein [Pelobates cultripes]
MLSKQSMCKIGLWVAALGVILHVADAQTTITAPGLPVPGWGIALLVLMSLFFAAILICMCCVPVCCRGNGMDAQGGMSSVFDRVAFWK